MPDISENALMMSIQAIHQLAEQYGAERDAASGSEQADYDEIIESYEIVAMELKAVYEKARSEGADLPPYASLLG
ncbi:MAG: hypothetical protein KDH15_12425 [Rhodocyclaceae bacterium]|nr:hypothetical protein [Rhodocyclaceae bacterium]